MAAVYLVEGPASGVCVWGGGGRCLAKGDFKKCGCPHPCARTSFPTLSLAKMTYPTVSSMGMVRAFLVLHQTGFEEGRCGAGSWGGRGGVAKQKPTAVAKGDVPRHSHSPCSRSKARSSDWGAHWYLQNPRQICSAISKRRRRCRGWREGWRGGCATSAESHLVATKIVGRKRRKQVHLR